MCVKDSQCGNWGRFTFRRPINALRSTLSITCVSEGFNWKFNARADHVQTFVPLSSKLQDEIELDSSIPEQGKLHWRYSPCDTKLSYWVDGTSDWNNMKWGSSMVYNNAEYGTGTQCGNEEVATEESEVA